MLVDWEVKNINTEESPPPILVDQSDTSNPDPIQVNPETKTMCDLEAAGVNDLSVEESASSGSAVVLDGSTEVGASRRRYRRTAATSLIGAASEEMAGKPALQVAGRKPPSAPRKTKKKAE